MTSTISVDLAGTVTAAKKDLINCFTSSDQQSSAINQGALELLAMDLGEHQETLADKLPLDNAQRGFLLPTLRRKIRKMIPEKRYLLEWHMDIVIFF
jgi:hypothetical protein